MRASRPGSIILRTITCFALAALCHWPFKTQGQFVAFWDHVPGLDATQTHPNTTLTNIPNGYNVSRTITLKNITNGLPTRATLMITNLSLVSYASSVTKDDPCQTPAPGTPLYKAFYYAATNPITLQPTNYSYVYFGQTTQYALGSVMLTNSAVRFIFQGLNPDVRYSFKGGAVRGDTNAVMRWSWTCVEISGADSFVPNMTANVLTSAHTLDLATNQVAVNFGRNHTPDTGDMVDWEQIKPAADGTFAVTCTRYTGTVPDGSSGGGRAFAMTGFRLEEIIPPKLSLCCNPNGTVTLQWEPGNGILQESSNLTHWTTSAWTNGATRIPAGRRFFRVSN